MPERIGRRDGAGARRLAAVSISVGALVPPSSAHACKIAPDRPFHIDASMQATDKTAPTLPPLSLVGIERGKGPQRAGCNSVSESDCDYRASIAIGIAATDDVTPSDSIGYRFSIVGGTPPQGLSLPTVPVLQSIYAGQTGLGWDDGATDDQESFDFTLQVVAVDLAGNESAPQTLRIQHDPSTGCGVARVSSVPVRPATTFTLLAIAAVVRRTARRRPARRLTSL